MPTNKQTANKPSEAALRKEARELRRALQRLSDAVLLHLHVLDGDIGKDTTIPQPVGSRLAKMVNLLDMENDLIRFNTLGVDYRKDNKPKAVQKLLAKRKTG